MKKIFLVLFITLATGIFLIFYSINTPPKESPVIVAEEVIEEPIAEELMIEEPEPIVASYDIGKDLILVESNYKYWYSTLITNSTSLYCALYWNSNHNIFYGAGIKETTNFTYSLETNKQFEPVLFDSYKEVYHSSADEKLSNIADTCLLYAGTIIIDGYYPVTNRLYVNKANNKKYIKTLYDIEQHYYDGGFEDSTGDPIRISSPIFPVLLGNDYMIHVIFTNTNQQVFHQVFGGFDLIDYDIEKRRTNF